VFGALDVPLVYFSIWFFRTQHPQPVIGGGGSMDPRMLHVLLISWLAFLMFRVSGLLSRFRLEKLRREVEEAYALESAGGRRRWGAAGRSNQPPIEPEPAMNTSTFLFHYGQYVAYAAAWLIHGAYIGSFIPTVSPAAA